MSLLRNVLAGIGSYLLKKGELDLEAARDQLKFDREIALERVKESYLEKASARDHTERLDEIHQTGIESRRTDLVKGIIEDRRDQAKSARDLQSDLTLKAVDFNNSAKLDKLRAKLDMTKEQFKSVLDAAKADRAANSEVDHWVVSPKGELGGYNKKGALVVQSGTGVAVPGGAPGTDLSDLLPGPSSSRTAPEPTPQGIAPAPAAPVLSQLHSAPPPPDGKVGRTMTGPGGMKATWNGKQWVLADVNGGQ